MQKEPVAPRTRIRHRQSQPADETEDLAETRRALSPSYDNKKESGGADLVDQALFFSLPVRFLKFPGCGRYKTQDQCQV